MIDYELWQSSHCLLHHLCNIYNIFLQVHLFNFLVCFNVDIYIFPWRFVKNYACIKRDLEGRVTVFFFLKTYCYII
jgi:hypothetical protein